MNDFLELALYLKTVMIRAPALGHLEALDPYNRQTSIGGTARWTLGDRGHGFLPWSNGRIVVADGGQALEQQVTEGTLWIGGDFTRETTASVVFMGKRDGFDDINFYFYYYSVSPFFNLYDSLKNDNLVNAGLVPPVSDIACNFGNGQSCEVFREGVSLGSSSGTATITKNDAYITIGANWLGGSPTIDPIGCAMLFPSRLEPDALSLLHVLWERAKVGTDRIGLIVVPRDLVSVPDLHMFGISTPRRKARDISDNGRHGDIQGGLMMYRESGAIVHRWVGGSGATGASIEIPSGPYSTSNQLSAIMAVEPRGDGEASEGRLLSLNTPTTVYGDVYLTATKTRYRVLRADGMHEFEFDRLPDDRDSILVLSHDKSSALNLPLVSVDGAQKTVTEAVSKTGALSSSSSSVLNVGNNADGDRSFDGCVREIVVFSTARTLGQLEVDAKVMAGDRRGLTHDEEHPISLADISGGCVGPHRVESGAFRWKHGERGRYLECITAGVVSSQSRQAYGAWYGEAEKAADVNVLAIVLIAEKRAGTGGGQNGYVLYFAANESIIIERRDNGGLGAQQVLTAAPYFEVGVRYRWFVTRDNAGKFTVYLQGGAYKSWQTLGTWTDNVHTVSYYFTIESDAGDISSDIVFFPRGAILEPADLPERIAA